MLNLRLRQRQLHRNDKFIIIFIGVTKTRYNPNVNLFPAIIRRQFEVFLAGPP